MSKVLACIDGTAVSPAVCDYAAWASLRLEAPLMFLHVLDKSEYPIERNLSGSIGMGSREALLEELAALDEQRGRLAWNRAACCWRRPRARRCRRGRGFHQPAAARQPGGDPGGTGVRYPPAGDGQA
jgi:hypothetical protein